MTRAGWFSCLILSGLLPLAAACERTETWSRAGRAGGPSAAGGSTSVPHPSGGTSASSTPTEYGALTAATRHDVVVAAGDCAVKVTDAAAAALEALSSSSAARGAAPSDAGAVAKSQADYRAALEAWSEAEVVSFGPAGGSASSAAPTPGGQDLGPAIYGWPLVSRCEIEKVIVSQGYAAPGFATTTLLPMRSLAALDYLAFHTGADQACGASSAIAGPFGALGAEELGARRAAYAAVVAADTAARARALANLWSPKGGNFVAQLSGAGQGSGVYASDQLALNAISDAMFHLDQRVKDRKLGQPLGLIDCGKATCPEAVESTWAGHSRESLRRNLLGFRRLATGCGDAGAGVGFDDLLFGLGQQAAADRLRFAVQDAIGAIDAVPYDDLATALTQQPATVTAARDAVKRLTDFLKSDFLTLLDLEPPKSLEGDND
ncbi:MAG: imelysin family protein [Polyangiaceae bacterium]|nr:imelysin family protein [Polyangiaceae bacterium]